MDKRTILAFALSFIVLLFWSVLFTPTPQESGQPVKKQMEAQDSAVEPLRPASPHTALPPRLPERQDLKPTSVAEKEIIVETPLYRAVFTNIGPSLKLFELKKYRQTIKKDSPPVNLVPGKNHKRFIVIDFVESLGNGNEDVLYDTELDHIILKEEDKPEEVLFKGQLPNGLVVEKIYRFYPDQYKIDLEVRVKNFNSTRVKGQFLVEINPVLPKDKKSYYSSFTGLTVLKNNEYTEIGLDDPGDKIGLEGQIGWIAFQEPYFISAVVPEEVTQAKVEALKEEGDRLHGRLINSSLVLPPGGQVTSSYAMFLGPLDLGLLGQFGKGLDKAINFGWTDVIAKPLLHALRFFNKWVHNYGVAIILLTILVKLLFWPLTHKSYKSMKEMQKLQPLMMKIREKYKNNKEQMNKELMALYKTYKVNPMSGCLPMIVQIPVFFALYKLLVQAIELRHAPFILWINDLSAPDRLFNFPFSIPLMAPPYGIPVLTLLMGASMFIQQKMTPTTGDPTQAKMMMLLPIVFTFLFINFPSGLVLYWLVNNILSIAQQYAIYKKSS